MLSAMMLVHVVALVGVLVSLVTPSVADTCRGYPGVPGIPGKHGSHGKDGVKGEKGDRGDDFLLAKGQKGEPGLLGPPGRSGIQGDPGMPGVPGLLGPKGERGTAMAAATSKKSFFSFKKRSNRAPTKDQPIRFDLSLADGDTLHNGEFHCEIKGCYFFTYHVTGRTLVCLNIKKGTVTMVGFCDSGEKGYLVTSGSVVLQLDVGDKVSVQTTENNLVMGTEGADSIFTGFLLFPMS
ncbi:complement C1q subcomponent subunit B isoform X1 [Megalops cyprinoides]|uniref:complement C1q subcomponent subunit B isoform X1 n=2 Tax=Megalops cyprinoides TaxID=118141 RepID=UPI00186409E6|nr:complement C1q subcomponent subunit B isoform X1 [Megalops cyprinoides]